MSADIAHRESFQPIEGYQGSGSESPEDLRDAFSRCSFQELPKLVSKHRGGRIDLKSPQGSQLRIAGLEGTVYWGREEILEDWETLYLPEPEKMVVMGAIDNVSSLAEGLQLIVLVGSQRKVYFYESWILHLVAESIEDFLLRDGGKSPPIGSFEYGEFCAPQSEEEYLRIMNEAGIPLVSKATKDFVQSREKSILAHLDFLEKT